MLKIITQKQAANLLIFFHNVLKKSRYFKKRLFI